MIEQDVTVVVVILIVKRAAARANGGAAIGGGNPHETQARRHIVQRRLDLLDRWRSAVRGDEPLIVAVDELIAVRDARVGVPADAEVQREIFARLPRVLNVRGGVPMRFDIRGNAEGQRVHERIRIRIGDIERPVCREVPAAVLRRVDVHEEFGPRHLSADLQLMSPGDV